MQRDRQTKLIELKNLQRICDQVSEEIGAVVTIFAEEGKIVCSSQRSRIGLFHDGVARIMAGDINQYEATASEIDEARGILEGAALPIELDGKRLFCVSVAAPVGIAHTYCRLVQHWVVAEIREEALVRSETRFRDVAESAGDWIWEMNEDLRFIYLSPRFYELFEVSPDDVLGKTRAQWAGMDVETERWREHEAKLTARLPFRDFGYTVRLASDRMRHVKTHGKPIYGSDGVFAGYRGTGYDVTEQKEMERALERTRQLLADSIETIPEAFSLFDGEDQLVIFNGKYHALLLEEIGVEVEPGMTFETIIRRGAATGRIPEAVGREEGWVRERLERHRELSEPHIQERGEGRWLLVSEHRTSEGGTVAIYSDISDLKQNEQNLAEKSEAMEQLSNQLAKYLSPQVYASIFSGEREVRLHSRRRKLTVFFSDIVGFTETADRLESEELTQLLNHYLSEMSEIALGHGATIDKYVGDAIMIFFGDPESSGVREDALRCARMATDMQKRMQELRNNWRDAGIDRPLRCRMGINTGFCTVGNFGSENRMDYTIIGSGVNLASRLETAAKPDEILISYETYSLIKEAFDCEERGELVVRGQAYPVATYAIKCARHAHQKTSRNQHQVVEKLGLNFDPASIPDEDRNAAIRTLQAALKQLENPKD